MFKFIMAVTLTAITWPLSILGCMALIVCVGVITLGTASASNIDIDIPTPREAFNWWKSGLANWWGLSDWLEKERASW